MDPFNFDKVAEIVHSYQQCAHWHLTQACADRVSRSFDKFVLH